MNNRRLFAMLLLAAASASCGGDVPAPMASAPHAPHLTAGPTAYVLVACPDSLVDGQHGQCSAAGYDSASVFTGSTATWSTSTPAVLSVSDSGRVTALHLASGAGIVNATIGGVTGHDSIAVRLSNLAVSILGPSSVRPSTTCAWSANASGGRGSYGYAWSRPGTTEMSTASDFYTQGTSNFTVNLTVTDSVGTWRSASKAITVSSSARICAI